MKYWGIGIRMQEKCWLQAEKMPFFGERNYVRQGTSFLNHADLGKMTSRQALSMKSDQIAPTWAFLLDSLAPLNVMENEESTLC